MPKVTVSVIKADVGGYGGHSSVHPALVERAREMLERGDRRNLLLDSYVATVGDDINLILTHERGVDDPSIHRLCWDTFVACTEVAKQLKLYGAGQDLLKDSFAGNVKGMGPGVAEMELEERPSEPIVVFCADKCDPGAWNLPIYKMFADPFNSIGLVIDPKMHAGFNFEVHDLKEHQRVMLSCPEELYALLAFIGSPSRYVVKAVYARASGDIAASTTTQKLREVAGRYVGKDDPACIVRCQSGLPAVGEVLEPFANPHLVAGWMRGSSCGPLMPCAMADATPSRFDGPPRVIALGFQLANGKLVGPRDFFADKAFDKARDIANEIANYMRRMGPFEPARLPMDEMEYTTMPQLMAALRHRFDAIPEVAEEKVPALA